MSISRHERYQHLKSVNLAIAQLIQRAIRREGGFPTTLSGSNVDLFRPPVCNRSEPSFSLMRSQTSVRNNKLFGRNGQVAGELVRRFVVNLHIFDERVTGNVKMTVLTKNQKSLTTKAAGFDVGEKNVLLEHRGRAYMGEQRGRHVFVLRPVAGEYQGPFIRWLRELIKK